MSKEKLRLNKARSEEFAPGMVASTDLFRLAGFTMYRFPGLDDTTGEITGFQPEGSFIDAHLIGRFGVKDRVRLAEGQRALDLMAALNTLDLSTVSLIERLMDAIMAHEVVVVDPKTGEETVERPFAGIRER